MNSARALSGVGTVQMPCAFYGHFDIDAWRRPRRSVDGALQDEAIQVGERSDRASQWLSRCLGPLCLPTGVPVRPVNLQSPL